jgi:Tol biopolymer transport system component
MPDLIHRLTGALAARYRIEREIGHGGMAVVFLARDLRHDRAVAIKVLRPELAGVLGPERFLREIQVAARLTHPHILPMLDSGDADGLLYYTMPFVEGETLRQRLEREKQLPVEDTLRIAREVAGALDHAHRQGVVHRDVKPENILFAAGHAMVADFGIAHAMEAAGGGRLTTTGVVLGTPAYLSPEQAAGSHALDARSDQYSLGCVVYEMLAGQPPFTGPGPDSLLHQHLNVSAHPVTELRPAVPAALAASLARALAKNPADRFADTACFADSLALPAVAVAPARAPARGALEKRVAILWAGLAVAVIAAAAIGLWTWLGPTSATPELNLTRLTYDTGVSIDPAISRDGKLLAYTSDRGGDGNLDLWVQYVGQRSPLRLTRGGAANWQSAFSPDGASIVFRSERDGGGLYLVNTLGGQERRIADRGTDPRFSPDGSLISFVEDVPWAPGNGRRMFLVTPDGGPPRPFQTDFITYARPTSGGVIWSPDGKHLMFYGARPGQSETRDWWIAPADGGAAVRTGALRSVGKRDITQFPCLWLPGHIIFVAGTTFEGMNLYQARVHAGSWKVTGPVEQLTAGPGMKYSVGGAINGTLVMPDFTWVIQLWSLALDPITGRPTAEPALITSDAAPKFGLAVSHDRRKLAYSTVSGPREHRQTEVRVRDLVSGDETAAVSLTSNQTDLGAVLDPQGATLAYQDRTAGAATTFILRGQETAARELCRDCAVACFLPGSGDAVVTHGLQQLARRDLATEAERTMLRIGTGSILNVDAATGDRWLAVLWGRPERALGIYAVPVRDSAATERDFIPLVEGPWWFGSPRWSTDGSRLYYLSNQDGYTCIWMRRVDPASGRPIGEATPVFHAHRTDRLMYGPRSAWSIAVTPDRLIFNAAEIQGNIWQAKLEAK